MESGTIRELLSLIGEIYDAAIDPTHWTYVLGRLASFLEVSRALLVLEDAVSPEQSFFYSSHDMTAIFERYVGGYMLINPARLAMVGRIKDGDTVLTTDYMTPAEYRETRFAKEFLSTFDTADIAVGVIEKTATRITILSAQRSLEQGFADEALREKLVVLIPHIQRAVRIAAILEHKTIAADNIYETLDLLQAAVILVNRQGTIVHANNEAARMLADQDVVSAPRGSLVLNDRDAAAVLSVALDLAARDEVPEGEGRHVPLAATSGQRFILTVMPLGSGRRQTVFSASSAIAAVCIKKAEFDVPSTLSILANQYDLTKRELAVLVASVDFGTVPQVAAVMGLSAETVKTHLKSIYQKTGARRQGDLVKLAAGIASPFAPSRT